MKQYRLVQIVLIIVLICFFTSCTQQETDEKQSFSSGAAESNANVENDVDSPNVMQEISENYLNRDILAACAGTTITQTVEGSAGRIISIDAKIDVDGISRVSCYRYVSQQFTDASRESLLKKMHPASDWDVNAAAVFNTEKGTWEFVTPLGENWMYQVRDSIIPNDQILNHEKVDANLDYATGNLIKSISVQENVVDELFMETTGSILSEIEVLGERIIIQLDDKGIYSCNYIHICENGEHRYAKVVFKRIIDGMPVTIWHNFSMVMADGNPFPIKVWGSIFSTEEIGLSESILTVQEAVDAMKEQIDSAQIPEETQVYVTEISLEYLTVISSEDELHIVPVWRFCLGSDETERSMMSEKILAVNAVSGELIWENREAFWE